MAHPNNFLRQNVDLALVFCYDAAVALCILVPYFSGGSLRVAISVLFMLFIPGYSVIAALFPANNISTSTRALFSFGIGIPVISLIGLGANYAPWGITVASTTASLLVFSIFCIAISAVRRRTLPERERFAVSITSVVTPLLNARESIFPQSESRLDRTLTLVFVASILIATSALAYAEVFPQHAETLTEFYLLGPDGKADNYHTQFVLGTAKPVTVGVTNREQQQETYELRVTLNDSAQTTTLYREQISLNDGQTWQKSINLQPDRAGTDMKVG